MDLFWKTIEAMRDIPWWVWLAIITAILVGVGLTGPDAGQPGGYYYDDGGSSGRWTQ